MSNCHIVRKKEPLGTRRKLKTDFFYNFVLMLSVYFLCYIIPENDLPIFLSAYSQCSVVNIADVLTYNVVYFNLYHLVNAV